MITKQIFDEKQPSCLLSQTGRVLVCANEQEVQVIEPVLDDEGAESGTKTVTKYQYDTIWLKPIKQSDEEILASLKAARIEEIDEYDVSSNVNSFTLNGQAMWLDRDTRLALRARLEAEQAVGKTESVVWYEGYGIDLQIAATLQMLTILEVYASECYDVTASHKAAVNALETLEDVISYNIEEGYPEAPAFSI